MTQCLYDQLGEQRADGLVHSLINSIGAEDQEGKINFFGEQNGIGEAANTVREVYQEYQQHVVDYVSKKTGVDGMKVLEWAYGEFDRASWQEVTRLHFFRKSMAGYDAIIREYRKAHSR